MPISDPEPYPLGHFKRVYQHVVKPACEGAGYKPMRADNVQATNHIVIDILRRILAADIAICDLSSKNPNVLYELGIRQAFNLPVVLIKDVRTERIFDIQGLRDIEYDENLRIDTVQAVVTALQATLINTSKLDKGDVNSVIQLLGVKPPSLPSVEVSKDTSLVLEAISDLAKRISRIEDQGSISEMNTSNMFRSRNKPANKELFDKNGKQILPGMKVHHGTLGSGTVTDISPTKSDRMILGHSSGHF